MGELYEAADLELNEHVALKTIQPEIAANERINQCFKREVQLARKITHPNICRIYDAPRSTRELESIRSDAVRLGRPGYEFAARRALAAIEGPRSTAGAARIAALQKDAQQRGFLLYAQ